MHTSSLFHQMRPQWQGEIVYDEVAHTEKKFPKVCIWQGSYSQLLAGV